MFFPYLILFLVPIFFSHILFPFVEYPIEIFGITFGKDSSFERVKVILFFILVFLGILEALFLRNRDFFGKLRKDGLTLLIIALFPLFVFYGKNFDKTISEQSWTHFPLGSHEKFHGYIFFVACICCYFIFSFVRNKNKLIKTSLLTAGLVAFFAILEFTKLWEFFPHKTVTWEMGRTLSTLGNPNYVAGYLLLHLPLCFILRNPERYIFLTFLIFAIITTGSFIGIGLTAVFLLWRILKEVLPILQKKFPVLRNTMVLFYIFICIFSLLGFTIFQNIGHEKWLSFESRGILMSDLSFSLIKNPIEMLFGSGPDSIIIHYMYDRTPLLDNYFPHDANIDSSHSILLDILYQYGILLFGGLIYFLWKKWRVLTSIEKTSLILFLSFFSFNVVILASILPIILILSHDRNR